MSDLLPDIDEEYPHMVPATPNYEMSNVEYLIAYALVAGLCVGTFALIMLAPW